MAYSRVHHKYITFFEVAKLWSAHLKSFSRLCGRLNTVWEHSGLESKRMNRVKWRYPGIIRKQGRVNEGATKNMVFYEFSLVKISDELVNLTEDPSSSAILLFFTIRTWFVRRERYNLFYNQRCHFFSHLLGIRRLLRNYFSSSRNINFLCLPTKDITHTNFPKSSGFNFFLFIVWEKHDLKYE